VRCKFCLIPFLSLVNVIIMIKLVKFLDNTYLSKIKKEESFSSQSELFIKLSKSFDCWKKAVHPKRPLRFWTYKSKIESQITKCSV